MIKKFNVPVIVIALAFVTLLLLAKVYISNRIYILSRDIQKTMVKIDALKEEQSILKLKTEKLEYINKIVDSFYTYYSGEKKKKDNQNNKDTLKEKEAKESNID